MATSLPAQRQLLRSFLRRYLRDVLAESASAARPIAGSAAAADCGGDAWPLFLCPTLATGLPRSVQPAIAHGPRVAQGSSRRGSGTRPSAQHRSIFTSAAARASPAVPLAPLPTQAQAPGEPSSSEVQLVARAGNNHAGADLQRRSSAAPKLRRALEEALQRHTQALNHLVAQDHRRFPVEKFLGTSNALYEHWRAASATGFLDPGLHDRVAERLYIWARIASRWLGVRDWQAAQRARQKAARRMDVILKRADADDEFFDRQQHERRVGEQRRALECRLWARQSPSSRSCRLLRTQLVGSRLSLESLRARAAALHGNFDELHERVEGLLRDNAALLQRIGPRPPPGFNASVPQLKPLAVAVGALYDAHVFSTRQPGEAMSQRNNRVAVRMLDWLFAHPSALIFAAGNDFAWAVRPLNDLIAMLRDPVGATERAWQAQTAQWRALFGHATLLVVVLGLCARKVYGPAVDLYFLASDKLLVDPDRPRAEAVLPELVRRRMLQRMSFAKEDTLAWQMTREIERRAPSGALERLEQGTLRALGTHYARHTQSSRVSAILDVLATHEDRDLAAYAFHVRMLCAVRSGDVAECQRVAATRYDLDPQPGLPPKPGLLALTQEVAGDLLRATLRKGDIVGAEEWLERHAALGIRPSRPAFNGLLTAYARRGDVTSAISLFEDMTAAGTVPDKASYTALIVLFGVRKDAESASRAMRAMRAAGLRADRVAYGALLDAFVESAAWDRVVELYNWLASQPSPELRPMAGAANALLKSHVLRASPLQTVLALFDEMRLTGIQPDARTYSLLLQSAADAGDIEQAEDIFTELERVLPHDPDSQPGGAEMHHFTIMMHTYLRRGEVDTARSYYEEMRQRGIEPNAVTWSILIETYIRADDEDGLLVAAELANRLADEAETPAAQRPVWQRPSIQEGQPLEPIYGPLLAAAARRGDAQEAQRIILLLVNAGTAVSIPFWTMLLDAHRSGGDFAGCDRVWAHIYQQALDMTSANLSVVFGPPSKGLAKATRAVTGFELMGAEPPSSSDHREPARRNLLCLPLSIMLDVLSRSGRHVEVVQLWAQLQRDGFGFDPHNWNHLCVALVRAGRYEEAMRVINDVLAEAGPHDRHPARARRPQQLDSAGGQDGMLLGLGRPDIAAVSQAEGVATPSRPPSRRHQGRGAHDGAVDSYDASQHEESAEPKEDPDPPGELSEMAESLLERAPSYWYPHFDTMQALAGGLDEMRRSVPTRASSDESSVVEQDPRTRYRRLMQTYPRAADQLAEHGLRVQRIEQSYANNEKRAAWAAEAARAARLEE